MNENIILSLTEHARLCNRISSVVTDEEVKELVRAAIEDMAQKGVNIPALLVSETIKDNNPLAVRAVVLYTKAHYGIANNDAEAERYTQNYEKLSNKMALLTGLKAGG